jgi:hypothetical protein
MQVVSRSLRSQARPEQVHQMLAVHPVARRQGEQLDQGRRLPALPTVFTDGPRGNRYPKAA